MTSRHNQSRVSKHPRHGFTLVEMLVAVALVLLMMTMFTSIFQMATNSVSKQRVIAETDQRARSLTTILRADFAKRSMRTCFPYLPNESSSTSMVPFGTRTGYVYISCNDPASGQDDLIQFSVDARQIQTNPDQSLYYGASKLLWDKVAENGGANNATMAKITTLQFSPNQPEADEGDMFPNGASGSDAAEISIFLRGGNLIRRVMLLRKPLPVSGEDLEIQPKSALGNDYFLTSATGGSFFLQSSPTVAQANLWRYFDFSAVPANMNNVPNGVSFIGIDALSNDGPPTSIALGRPEFRFGFNPVTGISREHEAAALGAEFMGRYLQSETSADDFAAINENFNWPNREAMLTSWGPVTWSPGNTVTPTNDNPLDIRNAVSLNATTGLVEQFDGPFGRGGVRRVEDVLMSNVREFRIELWDARLERWVVPGHSMTRRYVDAANNVYTVAGDYHLYRNAQYDSSVSKFTYGPLQVPGSLAGTPHVFDTWHPAVNRPFANGNATTEIAEHQAPYYPLKYYPPRQDASPPGPTPITPLPAPAVEYDPVAGRNDANKGYWNPATEYFVGDIVFARKSTTVPGWNDNFALPNSDFEWIADDDAIPKQSVHIAYRCMGTTTGATSGQSLAAPSVPSWQSPGLRFTDNELIWEGFNNFNPLRSVRLTIRFLEPNSETPKQLTLIMPMTDEDR